MSTEMPFEAKIGESQGLRSTALSTKITAILSATYADIELRDALTTLDSRALQNTAETRRSIRRHVQKELIDANGGVVLDFGQVAEQLRVVGLALTALQNTCADIREHVAVVRTQTRPMLDEASNLLAQKSRVETKQTVLRAFNELFLLTDDELRVLTSGAEAVDDTFFLILLKAKKINKDCQTLLSSENQRLGLEILDQNSKHLNAAFQRLYRWLQREFKSLDLENPRINASVRRALRILAERPTLFQNCLDTFAEAREVTLSEMFYAALTGSAQTSSSQKPIDFSAHEPLRYVGDMLAWAHATTVSEREALESLFISDGNEIAASIARGIESEAWSHLDEREAASLVTEETFDGREALSQLVNRSLAGVAHLLSQRIDQVVHSHDEPVLAYKIANLVAFYHNIFTRLVSRSGFLATLRKIEAAALDHFRTTMHFAAGALQGDIRAPPTDPGPPGFLAIALDSVCALLKSYETSLTSSAIGSSAEEIEAGLNIIYTEALDPFLLTCGTLASTLEAPADAVFSINYINMTLNALIGATASPFLTAAKTGLLRQQIKAHAIALIDNTHTFLLATSGLSSLLAATEATSSPSEICKLPIFSVTALSQSSLQLDAFLPSAIIDVEARLGGLKDKDSLREVVSGAADVFVKDFERVEAMVEAIDEASDAGAVKVVEEEEAGHRLRRVFPRTTEEVRVLLS